ncbi:UMP kinase [Spirochaetia bacterium 38H-sp]|uniref:Uridylate kinase n=1 Tax=Rarispira pelagica TaxID=3141764 RepID=A0ABU9U9F1_9SPIR
METVVISLGGSIVVPDNIDIDFIKSFYHLIASHLEKNKELRFILVVGGGGPARKYQNAYREITGKNNSDAQDWIGIAATRLNAQLIKAVFYNECKDPVVTDPTEELNFTGKILIAAGWKPGFSTDFDAVVLGERFGAKEILNLSNIEMLYSEDPRKNPKAKKISSISWNDFISMIGEEWTPGKNVPFDPVAAKKAKELGMKVILASGRNLENLSNILDKKEFTGTIIQ